jgi:hypothetical protein
MNESKLAAPANIDAFVKGWTGGLGVQAVSLADTALRAAGVLPNPPKPASTLSDMPFIKAFVVRYPSMNTQPIMDFYDAYEKNDKALNTIKKLAAEGNAEPALRELAARQGRLFQLTPIKEGMNNAIHAIRLIEQNPDISPQEKRQLIDELYFQVNSMAKAGLSVIDTMEQETKE